MTYYTEPNPYMLHARTGSTQTYIWHSATTIHIISIGMGSADTTHHSQSNPGILQELE